MAVLSAVLMVPPVMGSHHQLLSRAAASLVALGLAAHWVAGYRRGAMPLAAEPFEALAIFLLLRIAPGNPLLPLLGLVFHSLYGRTGRAWARYLVWMLALLAAHASRGSAQLNGDLARAAGTALVPLFLVTVRSSTEGLEASERRLASLVQNSTDVVTILADDLSIRWQAESIRIVLGLDPACLLGTQLLDLVHEDDRQRLRVYFAEARTRPGSSQTLALRLRHSNGRFRYFEVVVADRRHDSSVGGFVLNMRDATDRLQLERDVRTLADRREHDALHDPLTGLANRRNLFTSLDHAIVRARANGERLALLLIDLDRFKELNDTLGHHVGDELLRDIRPRLLGADCEVDLLARLGGDEFAVLLPASGSCSHAAEAAGRIRAAIERPFLYEGMTLLLEASVGIAIYPDHADDAESLVRRADIAMYSAKRNRTGLAFYEHGGDEHSRDRLALLGELPQAIADGQLVLHYQPKIDLADGRICGVEALVRWNHPDRGLLYPAAFLSAVEQTGLMRPLTLRIVEDSLQQCARWRRAGIHFPVAVNLSAANLLDAGLPQDVERLLEHTGLTASSLQFEITERIMAADPVRIATVLGDLRNQGISLSLDDFGTGSSSLSYLRQLPVQELKIDKSFVRAAADGSKRDAAVVNTIVRLAHDLGLRSVAEGIETADDRARLTASGCDHGQGYGLAPPMPAGDITALIRSHRFGAGDPGRLVA
jgi:diguanylate cyclase (GGDEF)-like protein/PAS domain S-box-containing protein